MDGIMHGGIERCLDGKKVGWMDGFSHFTKTLTYINLVGPFKISFLFGTDRWMNA